MILDPGPPPRRTVGERLRSVHAALWIGVVVLLLGAVTTTGCVYTAHLACRGGESGACTIDGYGIFTTVGHVDLPVREIVEVAVDEHAPRNRRGPSVATVTIHTRTLGRIDLAGGQRLGSNLATSDAVRAAAALRALRTSDRHVDMWLGPPLGALLISIAFAALFWILFVLAVRTILADLRA